MISCKSFCSIGDQNIMIKCHFSGLIGERRLKISDVARDTGINRGTLTRLYHETFTRLDLEVIDKLCIYLDVSVCDLLEHIREK